MTYIVDVLQILISLKKIFQRNHNSIEIKTLDLPFYALVVFGLFFVFYIYRSDHTLTVHTLLAFTYYDKRQK